MTINRNRYAVIKNLVELGPEWAHGCDKCKCGIVSAPPLTGAVSLAMERLIQALDRDITFCECQAGTRYRANLLNQRQKLIEEARRDPRMQEQARRLSHPDIDIARNHIEQEIAKTPVPTIHGEVVTA